MRIINIVLKTFALALAKTLEKTIQFKQFKNSNQILRKNKMEKNLLCELLLHYP